MSEQAGPGCGGDDARSPAPQGNGRGNPAGGRVFFADDLANGKNIIFCATGISDSAMLRGVKTQGASATTYSILMRAKSRTVRFIRASHDLKNKTIRLRSDNREHRI